MLFNVVPGPPALILIGQVELRQMDIPTLWSLIEDAIRRGAVHKAQKASSALKDWKQRRIALSKD
jgi:hypothetical protein